MNEEIIGGLNNARAHGFSLEEAAQSFINAGYNTAEVREAQTFLGRGYALLPTTATAESKPTASAPVAASAPIASTTAPAATRQASKKTIILLVVLALLVLIAGIASVLMLYLK